MQRVELHGYAMRAACEKHPDAGRATDGRCVKCESARRMAYRACNLDRALEVRAAYKDREYELAKKRHAANPAIRRADSKRWRLAHPGKVKVANMAAYHADPAAARARVEAWRKANPEKVLAKARAWNQKNPEKAKKFRNESVRRWGKKYPDRRAAYVRGYQAAKLNATPAWANKFFIAEAYHLAKLREKICGGKWHVDHIVPLKHPLVCGLHVEHNLSVIPGVENSRKGNRYTAMP